MWEGCRGGRCGEGVGEVGVGRCRGGRCGEGVGEVGVGRV